MERKYNRALVAPAKALRKNMTPEERHLWYDFLRIYPIRFSRQKFWENTSRIFIARRPNW